MSESFLSLEDQALLRRQKYQTLDNDQWAMFMHAVDKYRLDPFGNQIYAVLRNNKDASGKFVKVMSIQTGIDGFRLVASRTGAYAGNDDAVFDNEEHPKRATVTVYKMVESVRCQFSASARWDQYYPGDKQGMMWNKMPHVMLGKCAEALALRKAFPVELAGLFTNDEMAQADRDPPPENTTPPANGKAAFGNAAPPPPVFTWSKATSAERKEYTLRRVAEIRTMADPNMAIESLKKIMNKLQSKDLDKVDLDEVITAVFKAEQDLSAECSGQ